ncbi:hypothetical protein K1719_033677 [Acacia pycnantha]|nr:hypothetical protein K1719_033677 [Acacia pycnantha]
MRQANAQRDPDKDIPPRDKSQSKGRRQDRRGKGPDNLRLTLGTKEGFKSERVRFIVADFPSPYNIILGRPTIHNWDMLVSTKHQKIKMIGNNEQVVTVKGNQKESRQCYVETINVKDARSINMIELDVREEKGSLGENRKERWKTSYSKQSRP